MNWRKTPLSSAADLETALGAAGQREYKRLLRLLLATQGMFAPVPIASDFPVAVRDALLERLARDLSEGGLELRTIRLSRENWNVLTALSELSPPASTPAVLAVVGLEETPGLVLEPGAPSRRPPALALLNNARESLRTRFPFPMLLWCDPAVFVALQEHAPDFYDYFMGLAEFLYAGPRPPLGEPVERAAFTQQEVAPAVERPAPASAAAVAFYEDLLARHPDPSAERARALLGLAENLWPLRTVDVTARLSRAEAAVREALTLLSPEDAETDWARGQGLLGAILSELPTGDRGENLRQAMACYQAALWIYTESDFPYEWAGTQNNLGNAYAQLPTGDRGENLQQAIVHYQAALRVYTEADFPQGWAAAQNNLGTVYLHLPTGDRKGNLQQAVMCYLAALRIYTEAGFPPEWAMTQYNLGIAYSELSVGDRGKNLRQAIACYQAALRVYTEADFPPDWARTQHNLGVAYARLLASDRRGNLRQAIAYFQAALRVYTEADFPQEWARTQFNLGLAFEEVGVETDDSDAFLTARTYFAAAARGYAAVGAEEEAAEADERVARIDTELAAGRHSPSLLVRDA